MTYSIDFRKKVLNTREKENLTIKETAKRFCIGVTTIVRWLIKIEVQIKRNKPPTKLDMEALKKDVELYPDDYLFERASRFNVSHNCIWHGLKRLNITYKKKRYSIPVQTKVKELSLKKK
jgi:transposase